MYLYRSLKRNLQYGFIIKVDNMFVGNWISKVTKKGQNVDNETIRQLSS